MTRIRLSVRALIVRDNRLLLVNAYKNSECDLWTVPGGGAHPHASLTENLVREVLEETGLQISVENIVGVDEFHSREKKFHQVDIFFRATITAGNLDNDWRDTDGVVTSRRFFTAAEMAAIRFKPDCLPDMAFGNSGFVYTPLEEMVL